MDKNDKFIYGKKPAIWYNRFVKESFLKSQIEILNLIKEFHWEVAMDKTEQDLLAAGDSSWAQVSGRISKHRTLEERATEYGGNLYLDGEYDWGGIEDEIISDPSRSDHRFGL